MNADRLQKLIEMVESMKHTLERVRAELAAEREGNEVPDPEPAAAPLVVAIVVGHKPTAPGACNKAAGVCEFAFNDWIADQMLGQQPPGVRFIKVHRHPGSYSELPAKINALAPDLVLSLHANGSHEGRASGTEMLYAAGSSAGQQFAELLQMYVLAALGLSNRGIKPRTRQDRGSTVLFGTRAPAVITEPFFIDNNNDYRIAEHRKDQLASAYVDAVAAYAAAQ